LIIRDVQSGREYPVSPGGLRIGRTSENDVVLREDQVSRNHATLWLREGRLYVRDENSTNGTFVNGERISAPRPLNEGDQVRIGGTDFQVTAGAAPAVPDEVAAAPVGTDFPVVPAAIAGGVIFMIVVAFMIRGLGGASAGLAETPTPTPTGSPAETAAPTEAPTATATARPSPRPTQPPASRATPVPQVEVPQLVAPAQGETYASPITFQWSGSLNGGQAYRVSAYHVESGKTIQSGLLTSQEWTKGLPDSEVGEWRWTVSIVDGGNAAATSGEGMFWFNPFPGSGGGDDDDGDGSSQPTEAAPTSTPTPRFGS
jgi:hypothetical protein